MLEISEMASQIEHNKERIAEKAAHLYQGPVADNAGRLYENIQHAYGEIGDTTSYLLDWLGRRVNRIGSTAGSMLRSGFHTFGDLLGSGVNRTEQYVGHGLIISGQKIHTAGKTNWTASKRAPQPLNVAIDLERASHQDGERIRQRFQDTAPQFEGLLSRVLHRFGQKVHEVGLETEAAGHVVEQRRFLETLKQASRD